MTNPERREKIRAVLVELYNAETGTEMNERTAVNQALSALKALMPEVMSEEEIYKIVYAVERKTCASEECEITCPAYKENEEYPCGARQRSRELAKALTIAKPSGEIYKYKGGEDDGYGGKTTPVTWKEAYEEQERYETWAMKEMKKACEKIKAHPKWEWGANAYPSSYERAIVAGCGQAVEELQKEIAILKAKPVMTKEEVEKILPRRAFCREHRFNDDSECVECDKQSAYNLAIDDCEKALASKLIGRG